MVFVKVIDVTTYANVERACRHLNFNTYLIAFVGRMHTECLHMESLTWDQEKEVEHGFALMNPRGRTGCEYHVGFSFDPPGDKEENLRRLADAGIPVDQTIPKYSNW
jgi:hypothetical protein